VQKKETYKHRFLHHWRLAWCSAQVCV